MSHSDRMVLQTAGVNDVWHYNEIHLDSSARDSGTNDEPQFFLPRPLNDVLAFKVLSAEIPFSYYLLHDDNNAARFTFYDVLGGTTPYVTRTLALQIPNGSYSCPEDLGAAWEKEMNQAASELNSPPAFKYKVAFAGATGSFTVSAVDASGNPLSPANNTTDPAFHGLSFFFPTTASGESIAAFFGCQPDKVYGNVDLGGDVNAYTYSVSTDLCNITGSNYLQLFSNLGNRLSTNFLSNGSTTSSPPVIARIPVNAAPFDIITYKDLNPSMMFDVGMTQIQNISLSLRLGRSEDHVLHLNEQPWSVVLMVLTQRDTTVGRHVYPDDQASRKRIRVR